jgi:hypothetical protein
MRNNFISLENGRVDRSETESCWCCWWWGSEVNVLVGWRLRTLKYDHLSMAEWLMDGVSTLSAGGTGGCGVTGAYQ